MPTSVRLDRNSEEIVRRLARRRAITKSEVIREAIAAYGGEQPEPAGASLYERLEHVIGKHPSGQGDLSENTGEKVFRLLRAQHEEEQQRLQRRPRRRSKS